MRHDVASRTSSHSRRPLALDRFKNEVLCEFAQTRITSERPRKLTAATLDRVDHDPERIEANEGFATFQGPKYVSPRAVAVKMLIRRFGDTKMLTSARSVLNQIFSC